MPVARSTSTAIMSDSPVSRGGCKCSRRLCTVMDMEVAGWYSTEGLPQSRIGCQCLCGNWCGTSQQSVGLERLNVEPSGMQNESKTTHRFFSRCRGLQSKRKKVISWLCCN